VRHHSSQRFRCEKQRGLRVGVYVDFAINQRCLVHAARDVISCLSASVQNLTNCHLYKAMRPPALDLLQHTFQVFSLSCRSFSALLPGAVQKGRRVVRCRFSLCVHPVLNLQADSSSANSSYCLALLRHSPLLTSLPFDSLGLRRPLLLCLYQTGYIVKYHICSSIIKPVSSDPPIPRRFLSLQRALPHVPSTIKPRLVIRKIRTTRALRFVRLQKGRKRARVQLALSSLIRRRSQTI
jgi:hypothetical protein